MTIARCDLVPSYFYSFLTANAFYFLVEQTASEVAPRGTMPILTPHPPCLRREGLRPMSQVLSLRLTSVSFNS